MNNNFKLYQEVINYSNYIRKYVVSNITNVQRDLKIHLLDEVYNLKRYLLEAIYTKGNIRVKNINEIIVAISMIDILSNEIVDFCPKSKKTIIKSLGMLTKIKNMTYAWRNNPEVKWGEKAVTYIMDKYLMKT